MDKILNILKTGGAIVLAGLLAFILWGVVKGYQEDAKEYRKLIGNDMEHVGGYIQENTKVMVGVQGALEANTKQMERIENVLNTKL